MQDLNQLALQFIAGEWIYNANDKSLKHTFASNKELTALNLIDKDGYLDSGIKSAITQLLGEDILTSDVKGPFGDNDIFSGDIVEEETFYNIELFQITESTLDALQKKAKITISSN
jgi:hypothetical protein